MVVIVAAAAMAVVVMVVMIVVMVMVMMVMLMVVIVAAAAVIVVIVVVMLMLVVMLVLMLMLMLVMVAADGADLCFLGQLLELGCERVFLLEHLQDLGAGELLPGGGEDVGCGIVFPDQLDAGGQLGVGDAGGVAENDSAGALDLIIEEFAEVLHVHLALVDVDHCGGRTQLDAGGVDVFHRADDVAELADAGGLDEDAVGRVVGEYLLQGLPEIADQAAADTARVHLGDVDAGVLQEAAVDADIAEFVFDQHQLFTGVGLGDELFDEGGLSRAEKTGEYVDFRHGSVSLGLKILMGLAEANFRFGHSTTRRSVAVHLAYIIHHFGGGCQYPALICRCGRAEVSTLLTAKNKIPASCRPLPGD